MTRLTLKTLSLALLGAASMALAETCGTLPYDPKQYVCRGDNFLCPVVAGEGLSYCSGTCYSTFTSTCTANNTVEQLPRVPSGTPFSLSVSNPALPQLDGKPVTAQNFNWYLNGNTSTYCPSEVIPPGACPAGNITAMVANATIDSVDMNTMVPGGQQVYLDPSWRVAYTQPHSAYIPSGSTVGGFAAYSGGGFVNLNDQGDGFGWVACPPTAMGGGGGVWGLAARNETNGGNLTMCTPVNLKVNLLPPGPSAWEYL